MSLLTGKGFRDCFVGVARKQLKSLSKKRRNFKLIFPGAKHRIQQINNNKTNKQTRNKKKRGARKEETTKALKIGKTGNQEGVKRANANRNPSKPKGQIKQKAKQNKTQTTTLKK